MMKTKKSRINRVLLLCAILSMAILVTGVVAFMLKSTNTVSNDFVAAKVACTVQEVFNGTQKTSVKILNDDGKGSNIDAYIRIKMISYWQTKDGDIVGKTSEMPEIYYDGTKWMKTSVDSEYVYYYVSSVSPEELTNEFLTAPIELRTETFDDETVYQVVEFFAEAIQANPTTAVTEAWNVTLDGVGNIISVP